MENQMYDTLMSQSMKPYGKLSKLLVLAYNKGIISKWEFDAFGVELNLLVNNQNRSHNTIPRDYIEKVGTEVISEEPIEEDNASCINEFALVGW